MKLTKILVFAVLLFSFVHAATLNGDGTHKMHIGDTIVSSNDFKVLLKNITISYSSQQVPFLDSAIYDISYAGLHLETFTLKSGQSQSLSIESGHKNVTVTAGGMAYDPAPMGVIAYIPPKPYVNTTVESETYVPPPPDVRVQTITASTGKFWANISWTTNNSANATLLIYNQSPKALIRTINIPAKATQHSINVTGLKSGSGYIGKVSACTDNSCADSSELAFTTVPVIPVITDVSVDSTTNDTAVLSWKTDVLSDSAVYYREVGKTDWERVPPALSWAVIQKFFIFNFSDKAPSTSSNTASFSGKGGSASLATTVMPIISYDLGDIALPGEYSIQSEYLGAITDFGAIQYIIKHSHSIKLYDLKPETNYQFKVSSCADQCRNSSVGTFRTEFTVKTPYANIVSYPNNLNHGTSAVLLLSAYSRNPNGHLSNVKVAWTDGGSSHSLTPVFGGDAKSFISNAWPTLGEVSITFKDPGPHQVQLTVTDNYSKTSTETVTINVLPRLKCTSTSSIYYPSDTSCTNKWPNSGGSSINYNNGIGACHAFGVCDDSLDFMVADAESCCNGERSYSANPTKNAGYGYDKNAACNAAIANTRAKGPMSSLSAESSMKMCKASYLVYGIGSQAIYLKDYYTAEACCKAASFCEGFPHYQSWNPWPRSNIKFPELWCYWNDYWIFGKSPKDGWYHSDTNPSSNNNALADIPAHASVNRMNTGTCVDYSFVVTTALRKAGFGKNEVMSMRTPGHLYNVVWLPGDSKYSFIDTVGNTGGDFFTGPGWSWKSGGKQVNHCSYDSNKCSTDGGMKNCPAKSQVYGC